MEANHKFILYVDDDADDREFLTDAIKHTNSGVEVETAENGAEALSYLFTRKEMDERMPCLIVLDINMPFLDGKETFERLKKDDTLQKVPVIVFSSSEKPADKALFRNFGVEYFVKPNSLAAVGQIVDHMISVCC